MIRSYSEYFIMMLSLRGVNPNSQQSMLGQFQILQGRDTMTGHVEKNENLLGSVLGLIAWVRLLSRHTIVKIRWWDEPTQVGKDWVF